jgi:opacity protein-like surface antigen
MTKKLLFVFAILCALTSAAMAADVTGKWTWEQAGRGGGNPTVITLTLKADGAKLTGTMSRPGRNGNTDTEITDGQVTDNNKISFTIKRTMGDNEVVTPYKGIVDGDSLTLEFTNPGRGGGEPTPVKVVAKRATT